METQQAMEKRKMERFSLELPATLSVVNGIYQERTGIEMRTMDISAGGAFFYTEQTVPVGTAVKVDLMLPLDELKKLKGKRVKINVSGSVVRSEAAGMAVRFEDRYQIMPLTH